MTTNRSPLRWQTYFGHPTVGLIGSVASVVGLGLAVYFYFAASAEPKITVIVHPVRSSVVALNRASDLSIFFQGKQLRSDVSIAQVAIWNAGDQPVRASDVLDAVSIRVSAPILRATLRKRTRDVTGFRLDTRTTAIGKLTAEWEILERNDGGVIEIVYAGPTDAPVTASGTVVGQPKVAIATDFALSLIGSDQALGTIKLAAGMLFGAGVVFVLLAVIPALRQRVPVLRIYTTGMLISTATMYFVIGTILAILFRQKSPPFGF